MNAKELERWIYNRVQYKRTIIDEMNNLLLYADTFKSGDDSIKDLSNRITINDYVQLTGNEFEKIVKILNVVPEVETDGNRFYHYTITTSLGTKVHAVLYVHELEKFEFSKISKTKEETL